MLGQGALAFWHDIASGFDDEFIAWHVAEHIPERLRVPGFHRGRRYAAEEGAPRYFNFYETDTVDVLMSGPYLERLNTPTEWTQKVVASFRNTSRTPCNVACSIGDGEGAWMQTIRFSFPADRQQCVAELSAILHSLPKRSALVGAHLLVGTEAKTNPTKELELRGVPDQQIDGVICVESADLPTVLRIQDGHLTDQVLRDLGIANLLRGNYRLQYSLRSS